MSARVGSLKENKIFQQLWKFFFWPFYIIFPFLFPFQNYITTLFSVEFFMGLPKMLNCYLRLKTSTPLILCQIFKGEAFLCSVSVCSFTVMYVCSSVCNFCNVTRKYPFFVCEFKNKKMTMHVYDSNVSIWNLQIKILWFT